jgi:hypothetical protein
MGNEIIRQVSIVLTMPLTFDEIALLQDIEKFLTKYKEVEIVGRHLKNIEKR